MISVVCPRESGWHGMGWLSIWHRMPALVTLAPIVAIPVIAIALLVARIRRRRGLSRPLQGKG
jgi:hypothetical protein